VELVDLYPTIADYCGVAAPHALAGQSLRPLLEDPGRAGKEAAFTLVTRGANRYGQAVRTERWLYIQWSDGSAELYDEAADPEETHDLLEAPAQAAVVGELKNLIAETVPYHPVTSKQSSAAGK
jgi:iduronate 2-sulfatase